MATAKGGAQCDGEEVNLINQYEVWELAGVPRPPVLPTFVKDNHARDISEPFGQTLGIQRNMLHELVTWCILRRDYTTAAAICGVLWRVEPVGRLLFPTKMRKETLDVYKYMRRKRRILRALWCGIELLLATGTAHQEPVARVLKPTIRWMFKMRLKETMALELAVQSLEGGNNDLALEYLSMKLYHRRNPPGKALRTAALGLLWYLQWMHGYLEHLKAEGVAAAAGGRGGSFAGGRHRKAAAVGGEGGRLGPAAALALGHSAAGLPPGRLQPWAYVWAACSRMMADMNVRTLWRQAEQHLREGLRRLPADKAKMSYYLAQVLCATGRIGQATEVAMDAVRDAPADPDAVALAFMAGQLQRHHRECLSVLEGAAGLPEGGAAPLLGLKLGKGLRAMEEEGVGVAAGTNGKEMKGEGTESEGLEAEGKGEGAKSLSAVEEAASSAEELSSEKEEEDQEAASGGDGGRSKSGASKSSTSENGDGDSSDWKNGSDGSGEARGGSAVQGSSPMEMEVAVGGKVDTEDMRDAGPEPMDEDADEDEGEGPKQQQPNARPPHPGDGTRRTGGRIASSHSAQQPQQQWQKQGGTAEVPVGTSVAAAAAGAAGRGAGGGDQVRQVNVIERQVGGAAEWEVHEAVRWQAGALETDPLCAPALAGLARCANHCSSCAAALVRGCLLHLDCCTSGVLTSPYEGEVWALLDSALSGLATAVVNAPRVAATGAAGEATAADEAAAVRLWAQDVQPELQERVHWWPSAAFSQPPQLVAADGPAAAAARGAVGAMAPDQAVIRHLKHRARVAALILGPYNFYTQHVLYEMHLLREVLLDQQAAAEADAAALRRGRAKRQKALPGSERPGDVGASAAAAAAAAAAAVNAAAVASAAESVLAAVKCVQALERRLAPEVPPAPLPLCPLHPALLCAIPASLKRRAL